MQFRTIVPDQPFSAPLMHGQSVLSLGSCFAEEMGQRLQQYKFSVVINPFGILYQPLVLARALHRLITGQPYTADMLLEQQGIWRHYDFHSRYAHTDPTAALTLMNESLERGQQQLLQADWLILTLGTAYTYRRVATADLVANCHRMPDREFERFRATTDAMTEALRTAIEAVRTLRPALRVLISVSPVRHLRDGLIDNQRSKASLLLTAAALADSLPDTYYLPAYELVMDDLRDYRFYAADLAHPNALAVEYVWEYVQRNLLASSTHPLIDRVARWHRTLAHRPFFPHSEAHQQSLARQQHQLQQLEHDYPDLDFSAERAALTRQLG